MRPNATLLAALALPLAALVVGGREAVLVGPEESIEK